MIKPNAKPSEVGLHWRGRATERSGYQALLRLMQRSGVCEDEYEL